METIIFSKTKSMNSSDTLTDKQAEQGRAIARGIAEENARKEKNQAKAEKRAKTMLRNAAEKVFFQ